MPELPEVETVRAGLEARFKETAIIKRVRLMRPDIRFAIPVDLPKKLKDQPIIRVRRRAKYLIFDTPTVSLLSHLGMTGSWRFVNRNEEIGLHDHCLVEFQDGRTLVFRDPRRFGMIDLIEEGQEAEHPRLIGLGVEPLADEFTGEMFFEASRRRKIASKVFIMDQRIVVGIGNIYASEAFFRARVKPSKAAGKLTKEECRRLVEVSREILHAAIAAGGSSIRDYRSAEGVEGGFQNSQLVYDREGEACVVCSQKIKAKVLGGRSTFWCAGCQR